MSWTDLLGEARARLTAAGVPEPESDARALLFSCFDLDLTRYLLQRDEPIPEGDARLAAFWRLVDRRCERIPLQHLLGQVFFMGLPFAVNGDVLIPRPDTEILVETAAGLLGGRNDPARVLDLCTGSGCIAISLTKLCPGISCTAADLSGRALAVAAKNARSLGSRVFLIRSDLFAGLPGEARFDLIVSNPPYIPSDEIRELAPEVALHDPRMALDGGADGLYFYRRICMEAGAFLTDGGYLCVEIGHEQAGAVCRLFEAAGFSEVSVKQDLAGLDRVVYGEWHV